MFDLIVIGGGPAGVSAALRARELGATVALVERDRLGGTCTNSGCVPLRVWAKAARLRRDAFQFEQYGLVGAAAPGVDFARLLARTRAVVGEIHDKKRIRAHLEGAGISVIEGAGSARFTDAHTVAGGSGGETLRAEKFLLCAGGRPRRPDFPGADLARTPVDLWNLDALPGSAVIVGAAATGCQLASILAAFGVRVTLLEMAPRVLPGEDADVSGAMAEAFRRRGVAVETGIAPVERITREQDGRLEVFYAVDGQPRTCAAESVVLAVGWPGNVDTMNLAAAGVETEKGYVRVDDLLRTTAPNVWAAGDLTGRMLLVQSATEEGRLAAENALRGGTRRAAHRVVPHGGFTDPEYGSVGETEAQAGDDGIAACVGYDELDRAVIDGHPEGFCKLVVSRQTGEIRGAHVVGEQALEVVQAVAAGMAAGMRVEQLADLELAYPTFTGVLGLAARHLCREMGLICHAADGPPLLRQPRATEWEHRADDGTGGETG